IKTRQLRMNNKIYKPVGQNMNMRMKNINKQIRETNNACYWRRQASRVRNSIRKTQRKIYRRKQREIENRNKIVETLNNRLGGEMSELDNIFQPELPKIQPLMEIEFDDELMKSRGLIMPFDLFVDKDWNKHFKMNNSKFNLKHLMPFEISSKVSSKTLVSKERRYEDIIFEPPIRNRRWNKGTQVDIVKHTHKIQRTLKEVIARPYKQVCDRITRKMSSGSAITITRILPNIKEGPNDKGCQIDLFEPLSIPKGLQDLKEIKLNYSDDPTKEFLELEALTNNVKLDISAEILAVFGESEDDSDGELVKDTEVKEMDDTVFLDTPFDNEL
ncbi:hypothetical protein BpHYR1_045252, partial [Brachionus plicatilis]